MLSDREQLDRLPLPDTSPRGLFRSFGPGVILMMTGIGTSHLVTAPAAGGRFEFALLWCIPVAYIFKYHGFEMAFRFTNATGRSMLDAYATAPGKWPLWYVLVTTLIQCALGQAGRLVAASAVALLRLQRVSRAAVHDSGLRVAARNACRHAPARRSVRCHGTGHQGAGRSALRDDCGGLSRRTGSAWRARTFRPCGGAGGLLADHRGLPRVATDRHGRLAAGL